MWCIKATMRDTSMSSCGCCYHKSISSSQECVVATFDTKQQAEKYIKSATLKSQGYGKEKFRVKSLLCGYDEAWAEDIEESSPPPHNPVVYL